MADHPNRSGSQYRCVFVTVLWGEWHRGMFLNANLATMLAAGNLPAFAAGIDCEYLIYTTAKDAREMTRNGGFQRLRSLVSLSINLFNPSKTKHPIDLQQRIWRAATEQARRRGAFIVLMPPDVAWADGSFAQLRAALEGGKTVTFMAYPRVVSETIVPAIAKSFPPNTDQSVSIPARDMMALAVAHIHPLMAAHSRFSSHFSVHPELVIWPVESDGFLLRLLARELFCFEPGRYPLNSQSLLAGLPPVEEIQIFRDSRKFLGISLTPLWKDMEWYLKHRQLDPLFVGRWWITYDSPINDYISVFNLRFTCDTGSELNWRRAEQQAANLLTHLRFAREFVRVLMKLQQMGLTRAAAFLASALRVQGLARRWVHRGPFVILAPSDDAFETAEFHRVPGDGLSAAEARAMIEAHIAVVRSPELINDMSELTTLAGHTFLLTDAKLSQRCGDNLLVPVRTILYQQHGADIHRQAAAAAPPASGALGL
jgi:hypothetical protein